LGACGRAVSQPPPNIVLITIDTLRADRVGRGLTPSLDALARDGVTFANARATVPLTLPSHTTIMTGALPPEHGVRQNGVNRPDTPRPTLARILRDHGFQTGAFVGAYVLDRRFGLADGFDIYDDRIPRHPTASARLESERPADKVISAARDWLAHVDRTKPFFLWVHLYDPHAPYTPPAEYLRKANGHAYDGEVAFADAQAGVLLSDVRATFSGSPLVIAVAGDHGEGLGEHGEDTHGMLAYDSTLRVPLIVAAPGLAHAASRDMPASLRDLAPTLLARAGIAAPSQMSGLDLFASHQPTDIYAETTYPKTAGWSPLRVLVDGRWKLIAASDRELYDVSRDGAESQNVASQNPSVATAMASRADAIFGAGESGAATSATGEAAERLRALGYVAAAPAKTSSPNALNPRDGIAAWNEFENDLSLISAGRSADTLLSLRKLSSRFPDAEVFQSTLAQALKDTGRTAEALRLYKRLVTKWTDSPTLFHDLAVAAREAGEEREALRAEQAALALDAHDSNAQNGLGLIYVDAGRFIEAVGAFEKATTLDANNASFWTNLGNARRAAGDIAGADRAYTRALSIDPKYADAANGKGVLLVQQQRPRDAIALFEQALAANASMYEARLNLGIAYQEAGDRAKAAEAYRRVIADAPPRAKEKRAASDLLAALK
jgi:arylsulfatase A-like enzyme/Flp pilus assembly protein TadD